MHIPLKIVATAFLSATFALTAKAQTLEIPGSTTFEKRILEPNLAKIEKELGLKIIVRGINSGQGFKELVDGKARVSMSSAPLSTLVKKAGLKNGDGYLEHQIMTDKILVVTHSSNPVSELSFSQLKEIHTGRITHWDSVGGPKEKIIVVTGQPNAATPLMFQELVMDKEPYLKDAKIVQTTRLELSLVLQYKNTIGAVSEAFVKKYGQGVKVIKTNEIARPLSLITKGKPDADTQKLIDWLRKQSSS